MWSIACPTTNYEPQKEATPLVFACHQTQSNNEDFSFEYLANSKDDIFKKLTGIKFNSKDVSGKKFFYLTLLNEDTEVLNIYSDEYSIRFLGFIFNKTINVEISNLLKSTFVPTNSASLLASGSVGY